MSWKLKQTKLNLTANFEGVFRFLCYDLNMQSEETGDLYAWTVLPALKLPAMTDLVPPINASLEKTTRTLILNFMVTT